MQHIARLGIERPQVRQPNDSQPELHPLTELRLERWQNEPAVLGVILVGSKTRSDADRLSDDDLEVVLTDTEYHRLSPAQCHEFSYGTQADPPGVLELAAREGELTA